jgi:ADP-ribose pyrophosphatase
MEIKRPQPHIQLPENAKRVFKGEIFDVYQWEQKMFDGSTATFERLKRPDTVSVIPVLPDGQILLIDQEQPGTGEYVSCIAGRMEDGENPLASMQRELLEETGYQAEEWIFWDAEQPVHKIDWSCFTFIAKGLKKISEPNLDPGEKIVLKPVSLDHFLELAVKLHFVGGTAHRQIIEARVNEESKEELKKLFGLI